jgi:cellulose synthase (UDP-forming)
LAIRRSLPDEQRFFFDIIMPSRDAWNAAFCCGSNSVTRRAALEAIGGALPTQSITEDMLLSMALLRKGYVTRYLCERLAFGLAPETVDAFFVQRQRWARGAVQILYLAGGPLGRGLTLMQRLLFLPTHWLSLGLRSLIAIIAPIVFLWTAYRLFSMSARLTCCTIFCRWSWRSPAGSGPMRLGSTFRWHRWCRARF